MSEKALAHLKVVDLTHYIAGPYCTKMMADLGAEVIKIEKPGSGDPARHIGPFYQDDPHPEKSALFLYLNTSKKSVTLNLKSETGREIIKELIREADILVENFSPRVMPSLGLDYESLVKVNPRLVMTSISNFGQTGPYRDHKASEIGLLGIGGLMAITGEAHREPLKNYGYQAQYQAGIHAFTASQAALYFAAETGEGQQIDLSIAEVVTALLEPPVHTDVAKGLGYPRRGNRTQGGPWGAYPCKDGYVGVVAAPGPAWSFFKDLMGIPELGDPKYADRLTRESYMDEIDALMLPWLMERTKKEIYHAGQSYRMSFGYVATTEDLLDDPQMKAREFFVEIDHPETGPVKYPGPPFRMSETPWQATRAPLLGEQNEEILVRRLGYSKEDLVKMRERGII
ncbi:MAG: CoA transferase [Candidatus Tectomicrobia bacterium]|nr:CoA transferase [Candidatus Tectomicrobia bacterium]